MYEKILAQKGVDLKNDKDYYTEESWRNLCDAVNRAEKNTGSDSENISCIEEYAEKLESVQKELTEEITSAKNSLNYTYGFYQLYAQRITLDEYKGLDEYQNYTQLLLPKAAYIISSKKILPARAYSDIESKLEESWVKWRQKAPVNIGLYNLRDKILSSVGDKSGYSEEAWKSYQEALPVAVSMIDMLKNSTSATDSQGLTAIRNLQSVVDGLKSNYFQSKTALKEKANLAGCLDAYYFQAKKDTKEVKSPETVEFLDILRQGEKLIGSTEAEAKDYKKMIKRIDDYCFNVFQPALCVGKTFIKKARDLYYSVSKNCDKYTKESWTNVSDAMNNCDNAAGTADDRECQRLMDEMTNAVKSLKEKERIAAKFNISVIKTSENILRVDVNLDNAVKIVYGNFNLYYDEDIMEFISASDRHVKQYLNSLFYRLESTVEPLSGPALILRAEFKLKNSIDKDFPLVLQIDKLRDCDNSLIEYNVKNEYESKCCKDTVHTIKFDAKGGDGQAAEIRCQKYELVTLFDDISKKGYIFKGWAEADSNMECGDKLLISSDKTLFAIWEKNELKPLGREEVAVCAWCAIHDRFAVEEDYKMLAKNGIKFILQGYQHGSEQHENIIRWAEKYGVKAFIHDYDMNALGKNLTREDVLNYTEAYRNSPVFLGNDVIDEPPASRFMQLGKCVEVYKKALPEFDMHINLFPNYAFGSQKIFEDYINAYLKLIPSDHISTDVYPLSYFNDKKMTKANYYEGLYATAVLARDSGLSHWVYIQTMTGIDNRMTDLTDMRFQAYSCLAFGAGKIMHYCYDVPNYTGKPRYNRQVYCMRDYAHGYTELWDYGQILNQEIENLGKAYGQYVYKDTFTYRTKNVPAYVTFISEYKGGEIDISATECLVMGTFSAKKGHGKAFLIANAAELEDKKYAEVSLKIPNAKALTIYSDGLKDEILGNQAKISLKPGAGAFVTAEY